MARLTRDLPKAVTIQPIKLSPSELDCLLDELDEGTAVPALNQRRHDRHACRCMGVMVIVNQNGHQSTFYIPLRDISAGGIAFLHRSMLHQGTRCTVRIRTADRRWLQASGVIVRSRYVRDMIYEVGLKFDTEIDFDSLNLLKGDGSDPATSANSQPG